MAEPSDFRARARAIRAESRARLAALRQARRGGKTPEQTKQDATFVSPEAASLSLEAAHGDVGTPLQPMPHDPGVAADTAAHAAIVEAAAEPVVEATRETRAEPDQSSKIDPSLAPDAPGDVTVTEPVDVQIAPTSTANALVTGLTVSDEEALSRNDTVAHPSITAFTPDTSNTHSVANLPGIGPGLVWLFEQRGVHTLADFAAADPEDLRTQLGFISSLVDFDGWQVFARDNAS